MSVMAPSTSSVLLSLHIAFLRRLDAVQERVARRRFCRKKEACAVGVTNKSRAIVFSPASPRANLHTLRMRSDHVMGQTSGLLIHLWKKLYFKAPYSIA